MISTRWITAGMLAFLIGGQTDAAHACACCAEIGHRYVERVELGEYERGVVSSIAFAGTAEVSRGARDFEEVEGIRIRSLPLHMSVERAGATWTFSFDDRAGNTGHLVFAMPNSVTRFEIDPRDPNAAQSSGGSQILYKEWRLSAPAVGDGLIGDSVGGDQMATLIFQGRGTACPDASDFNAWSLVLHGSRAEVQLFGDLVVAKQE